MVDPSEEWVLMGEIGAAHGVQGWVKVQSYARPRENILEFARWGLGAGAGLTAKVPFPERIVELENARTQGKSLLVRLAGIASRNEAEALRGQQIFVAVADLPNAAENEFYWRDLIGLVVVNTTGAVLGQVDYLLETGANDVIVVADVAEPGAQRHEHVLPWVDEVVLDVDLAKRQILVEWPDDF